MHFFTDNIEMKQQKYYKLLQEPIRLIITISLVEGLFLVIFGSISNKVSIVSIWYLFLIGISLYGLKVAKRFEEVQMDEELLRVWYHNLHKFMYSIFGLWTLIFLIFANEVDTNLHYLVIFTQISSAVLASALLVSDKKLFVPILIMLVFPIIIYFLIIGTWYGYSLTLFSLILFFVLLYSSDNMYTLLDNNYYQAQHDVLTGIYNRRYFVEYMDPLNERLIEGKKIAYVFLIDLDHFKIVNDSLGHDIGDELLIEVARRVTDYSKKEYMFARLGGDEFILVSKEHIKWKYTENMAYDFTKGLLEVIRTPYNIEGHRIYISASIGLHQLNPTTLYNENFIKEIDIAMYEAKAKGRDGVIPFNRALEMKVKRRMMIERKLHMALDAKKIVLYYQPQCNINKEVIGCEVLARWYDEDLGTLLPSDFIPIAESSGIILELGAYILQEALATLQEWEEKNFPIKSISINISIRQLLSQSFFNEVKELIDYYFPNNSPKQTIWFEIKEHLSAKLK